MDATVPTEVPTIRRVSGMTTTIRIRKGMERRKLITTLMIFISQPGMGRTPLGSPATSIMPRGRPMMMANSVESRVT